LGQVLMMRQDQRCGGLNLEEGGVHFRLIKIKILLRQKPRWQRAQSTSSTVPIVHPTIPAQAANQ
jgi:hypothetical protein